MVDPEDEGINNEVKKQGALGLRARMSASIRRGLLVAAKGWSKIRSWALLVVMLFGFALFLMTAVVGYLTILNWLIVVSPVLYWLLRLFVWLSLVLLLLENYVLSNL